MEAVRQALFKPAGEVLFNLKGYGQTFRVNGASPVRDVAFGPWPEVLAWEPVGGAAGPRRSAA
jgi:hypothetical protein